MLVLVVVVLPAVADVAIANLVALCVDVGMCRWLLLLLFVDLIVVVGCWSCC